MSSAVVDNPERRRFELTEQGLTAFADYQLHGDVVVIPHVESPVLLRGQGTAGRLMAGALDLIRARGQKVKPVCPYAVAFIQRHPEYGDLVNR
jgi:predicted GNAT family acetyltransferase